MDSFCRAQKFNSWRELLGLDQLLKELRTWDSDRFPVKQFHEMHPQHHRVPTYQKGLGEIQLQTLQQLAGPFEQSQDAISIEPLFVWRQAHWDCPVFKATNLPANIRLREVGYVCFDVDLQAYGLNEKKLNDISICSELYSVPQWSDRKKQKSKRERTDIRNAGGEGYWSVKHRSFEGVKWNDGNKEKDLRNEWKFRIF